MSDQVNMAMAKWFKERGYDVDIAGYGHVHIIKNGFSHEMYTNNGRLFIDLVPDDGLPIRCYKKVDWFPRGIFSVELSDPAMYEKLATTYPVVRRTYLGTARGVLLVIWSGLSNFFRFAS